MQFSARKERGGEGREDVGANATTKNVLALKRERERETADRYGFHSRRRMGA